jgi:hypothetical protein
VRLVSLWRYQQRRVGCGSVKRVNAADGELQYGNGDFC